MPSAISTLVTAMLSAAGFNTALLSGQLPGNIDVTPMSHDEATAFLADQPALIRATWDKLLPELRAYAFTITGIDHMGTLQRARNLLATVPQGADWFDVKEELIQTITPHLVDPNADAETQAYQLIGAERRAELLMRMHTGRAYAVAQWRVMDAQRDVFPFWQYLSMDDSSVRPSHAALDGKIFPHDSPFWLKHYPPWEWLCRCQVVPLTQEEVYAIMVEDQDKPAHQRRVLTGDILRKVEIDQVIADPRRLGQNYSLAPASERGGSSPEWTPGLLQIPIDQFRLKYESAVFAAFESWAKTQTIKDLGQPLWTWINALGWSDNATPTTPTPTTPTP